MKTKWPPTLIGPVVLPRSRIEFAFAVILTNVFDVIDRGAQVCLYYNILVPPCPPPSSLSKPYVPKIRRDTFDFFPMV